MVNVENRIDRIREYHEHDVKFFCWIGFILGCVVGGMGNLIVKIIN